MSDWQITATTIYCDAVEDDVTIIVYRDWNTICTGYKKYGQNNELLRRRSKKMKKSLKCEGPEDFRVTGYKDKIMTEEAGNKA